ncbi:hypothetical protein J8273_6562 [Carpediemonas membranifera]|uniref:Uncharacterized protein n=1 Tax=Carpediemonas membranifera TaxID=201153 RepID=A0A8J6AR41_9EUKA|nr:hypothetical protein J8273_6562 [Carpediemonas membranifera]|eukprot:KAG9391783.1 hypothetical protein J8273_6562 [Carpediemonas membranifera]
MLARRKRRKPVFAEPLLSPAVPTEENPKSNPIDDSCMSVDLLLRAIPAVRTLAEAARSRSIDKAVVDRLSERGVALTGILHTLVEQDTGLSPSDEADLRTLLGSLEKLSAATLAGPTPDAAITESIKDMCHAVLQTNIDLQRTISSRTSSLLSSMREQFEGRRTPMPHTPTAADLPQPRLPS